MIKLEKY